MGAHVLDGDAAERRAHVTLRAMDHVGGVALRPHVLVHFVPGPGDRFEAVISPLAFQLLNLKENAGVFPALQVALGFVAHRPRFGEGDVGIATEREELFPPPDHISHAPQARTRGSHQQVEALPVGQFVRLPLCFCTADRRVGKLPTRHAIPRIPKLGISCSWNAIA